MPIVEYLCRDFTIISIHNVSVEIVNIRVWIRFLQANNLHARVSRKDLCTSLDACFPSHADKDFPGTRWVHASICHHTTPLTRIAATVMFRMTLATTEETNQGS